MINDQFAHMRTWSTSLAIYCIACTSVVACTIPGIGPSIMFEQVPTDIRFYSSEIIEATIYDSKRVSDAAGRLMWLVDARVDRVIKGSINTNTAKILFYDACTLFGGHGTILGELEDNPLWGRVLIPKQHYVR